MTNRLENRAKYPQPYSIRVDIDGNLTLKDYAIKKIHGKMKYETKYEKSKQSKRLYE